MPKKIISNSTQEYLEALYTLTRGGQETSMKQISERLNIAPASVTEMLKKLANKGYVNYSPYHGVTLTDAGYKIGEKMTRKHRLLERFLHDLLGISKDKVHKEACEMEHSLSDEAEVALCQFLGHPNKCPDDDKPIQPCDLQFASCEDCLRTQKGELEQIGKRKENLVSLADLKERDSGKIAFLRGGHKKLRRLLDMGLTPNTMISVVRAAPFGGPVQIAVRGSRLALGRGIASDVFVETVRSEPESQKHG